MPQTAESSASQKMPPASIKQQAAMQSRSFAAKQMHQWERANRTLLGDELRLTEMPPTSIKQQAAMQRKSCDAEQELRSEGDAENELTELDSVIHGSHPVNRMSKKSVHTNRNHPVGSGEV